MKSCLNVMRVSFSEEGVVEQRETGAVSMILSNSLDISPYISSPGCSRSMCCLGDLRAVYELSAMQ